MDLQSHLQPGSDATLQCAQAINDGGAIVVDGTNGGEQGRAYLLTPIPPGMPSIRIADAPAVTEGNTGTRTATFAVTQSAATAQTVTAAYATGNGTAGAGADYQTTSGTLTFAPGETSKTITIEVKGDGKTEADETSYLDLLAGRSNALFTKDRGFGTILNDD